MCSTKSVMKRKRSESHQTETARGMKCCTEAAQGMMTRSNRHSDWRHSRKAGCRLRLNEQHTSTVKCQDKNAKQQIQSVFRFLCLEKASQSDHVQFQVTALISSVLDVMSVRCHTLHHMSHKKSPDQCYKIYKKIPTLSQTLCLKEDSVQPG